MQVVRGWCQGARNCKMSLLFGLILPSVHFSVTKTASNTLRVKGAKENEDELLEIKGGGGEEGGQVELALYPLTVKRDVIREAQSPFHISLSVFFYLYSHSVPISITLSLSLSRSAHL